MHSPILLVDANNCLHRAVYANKSSGEDTSAAMIMLRCLRSWINRFAPRQICVFWDAPRSTVWRKKILPTYKANRDGRPEEIRNAIRTSSEAVRDVLSPLGVRQFHKAGMEADDLIYSACRVLSPAELIICSSDTDYLQIPYRMPSVKLFDPAKAEFHTAFEYDPAVRKALMGDGTDDIPGYDGIGKVKSEHLARSLNDRQTFLSERGNTTFARNLILIDLSLCPRIVINDLYCTKIMTAAAPYDKDAALEAAKKHKLRPMSEYEEIVYHFKRVVNNAAKE